MPGTRRRVLRMGVPVAEPGPRAASRVHSTTAVRRSRPKAAGQAPGFDEALITYSAPNPPATQDLPLYHPPCRGGRSERTRTGGRSGMCGAPWCGAAVEQMQDYLAQRMADELPAAMSTEERQALIRQARDTALDHLVEAPERSHPRPGLSRLSQLPARGGELLFARVPGLHGCAGRRDLWRSGFLLPPRHALNPGFGRDPRSPFFHQAGLQSLAALHRHGHRRRCAVCRHNAQFCHHPAAFSYQLLAELPPALHRHYLQSMPGLPGRFSDGPAVLAGLPLATVKENRCTLHGDACCEWEFTWHRRRKPAPAACPGWPVRSPRSACWPMGCWAGQIGPSWPGLEHCCRPLRVG